MHILVTGATGFIGRAIIEALCDEGHSVMALVRSYSVGLSGKVKQFRCDLHSYETLPASIFSDVDCVIHCAGLASFEASNPVDALDMFRRVNRDPTLKLADVSFKNGVRRFIFISSIKVNGEETPNNFAFLPDDIIMTCNPYAVSKYEAEEGLRKLSSMGKMEVVIVRLPLVYGPGVKSNFRSLIRCVKGGVPLPLGSINNRRSLLALDNLVSFILLCICPTRSPKATNEVFLLADRHDISTTELLHKIARAYSVRAKLFPVPSFLMYTLLLIAGKKNIFTRLFKNLQVDSSKAKDLLGWEPVVTVDEQLKKIAVLDRSK